MPRTTIDIAAPILKEIKAIQRREGRSLGQIASQLLAEALSRRATDTPAREFHWISKSMGALVDLDDKEALHAALDREGD
ncbi:MAG TPA: antitoxin [Candidatus Binatia bacterium]|nr:antitoxin [Candidatus Binatia bacterium]